MKIKNINNSYFRNFTWVFTALFIASLTLTSCSEQLSENSHETGVITFSQQQQAASVISTPLYNGAGFQFLPPIVKSQDDTGEFDGSLAPEVEICEDTECQTILVRFDGDGQGSERLRWEEIKQHYIVNWNTRSTGAVAGHTYRIRVILDETLLGYADVAVIERSTEKTESVHHSIVFGQTLPVKFRIQSKIEQDCPGYVDPVLGGCWFTSPEVGMTCNEVCAQYGYFDVVGSQHTGNQIGKYFWPDKADGSNWDSVECSSIDNNTNWGANGSVPDGDFSHPYCYLNCSCIVE
jgi:hypothetical protein